jgi:hypothetical protein
MPVPEAVDLGLSVKWASFNLGASYDTDYGDHFAWGETKAKGSFTWTGYKFRVSGDSYSSVILYKYNTKQSYGTVDNRTCLELWDDAARVNLGGKWRIPTYEEIEELRTQCYWTWTSKGYRVTSKKNQNSIFLPAAGYYLDGSSGGGWGTLGYYWSSSLNTEDPRQAWRIDFRGRESGYSPGYSSSSDWRYMGFSIRPVTE